MCYLAVNPLLVVSLEKSWKWDLYEILKKDAAESFLFLESWQDDGVWDESGTSVLIRKLFWFAEIGGIKMKCQNCNSRPSVAAGERGPRATTH